MAFLELRNLTKTYKNENGVAQKALNDFSIVFPNSGLVCIYGKSGSGKSTILNLIGLLDNPTSGEVLFNNQSINKWKDKKKDYYRNRDVGIIFQHYHLLEDETVLFNIMLPMLVLGSKFSSAKEDALALLKGINFPTNLYEKRCADLSGGEKQRVALLRSLINNPKIVLADEPTGALDENNARLVMEIIKKASRNRLVILISHNEDLTREYADRIITIQDGKLVRNQIMKEENNGLPFTKPVKRIRSQPWINALIKTNMKKGMKRNLIGATALLISLTFSLLISGFANGSKISLKQETRKQFDYGCLTICKENTKKIEGSPLSIVQQTRPRKEDLKDIEFIDDYFYIENNLDSLSSNASFSYKNKSLENVLLTPIFSFNEKVVNTDLLVTGELPKVDNLNKVIINDKCAELLNGDITKQIHISLNYEYCYYTQDKSNPAIIDYWTTEFDVSIAAVVDEIDFLSTPKIYYSYNAFQELAMSTFLDNRSAFEGYDISWFDLISMSSGNDQVSSFSYRLFLKNIGDLAIISEKISEIEVPLSIYSGALTISEALLNLVDAATLGMELFLVLAMVGTSLILGIITFSNYTLDKKKIATLRSFGLSQNSVLDIYGETSVALGLISVLASLVLSPPLSYLLNWVLFKFTSFKNLIQIPFSSFLGIPLFLPILIVFCTIILCGLVTYLPILFSKKICLKEELADQ